MLVNAGNGSVLPGPGVAAARPPVPHSVSSRVRAVAGVGTEEPLGWESPHCLFSLRGPGGTTSCSDGLPASETRRGGGGRGWCGRWWQ